MNSYTQFNQGRIEERLSGGFSASLFEAFESPNYTTGLGQKTKFTKYRGWDCLSIINDVTNLFLKAARVPLEGDWSNRGT